MKVAKFGGTSLADAQQIRKVCDIVLADPDRRLIVVSAPGKRSKADTKVTDLLIACAEGKIRAGSAEAELAAVTQRYREIARDLSLPADIINGITKDLAERIGADCSDKRRFLDLLKAAGEDHSARIVAATLRSMGADAHYVSPKDAGLILSPEYGNARVLPESYERLAALRGRPGITIFPGFFGYSPDGTLVTFPRGGSDITGSILAAAVKADLYENFTDVDSVFSANPSIITNPRTLSALTYREMRELSYAGFSVFHAEALEPLYRAGLPACIKNTNNPSAPGTMLVAKRVNSDGPVAGIASDTGFCTVSVSKYLMNREIGFGRRLLGILEDENLSYEHAPSGIDNISVILRDTFDKETETRLLNRIKDDLAVDAVDIEHELALVMIVGEGMRHTRGVAARATAAFARANVNIEMINQGSSEVSMMFGVKASDNAAAVRALYAEFFGK